MIVINIFGRISIVVVTFFLCILTAEFCLADGNKSSAAAPGVVASANANANAGKGAKAPSQRKKSPPVVASEKKGGDRLPDKDRKKDVPHPRLQFDDKSRVEKAKKRSVVKQTEVKNRVELFRHLPQYEHGTRLPDLESKLFQLGPVHPAVYQVISTFNLSCSWLLKFEFI